MKNEKTNIAKDNKTVSYRVVRGGYWGDTPYDLRSASRYFNSPSYRNADLGFRLVLQKKEKKKK
jgi:formylglycine-generating enzyme required for sulfatase activity